MKQRYILFVSLFSIIFSNCASAGCSAEDIQAYIQSGASMQQIINECGGSSGIGGSEVIIGNVCMTQTGNCPMAMPAPFNSSCYCPTINGGNIPGYVVSY